MKKLQIKNMVCPRCIMAVENCLKNLNISFIEVRLGEVLLEKSISNDELIKFQAKIVKLGFELLDDKNSATIHQIKTFIIDHVQNYAEENLKLSELLTNKLNKDYPQISKLFSSTTGITIEQFMILQKTEKVKELLIYDELSLKEIAYQLGYSSSAHLSAQFKKTSGLTPTQFKALGIKERKELDKI